MCATCDTLKAELQAPTITAVQADRIRTMVRMCERFTANPVPTTPLPVMSQGALDAMEYIDALNARRPRLARFGR